MSAYYNEFDPFAAAWLRELIADGLIAPGDVDERDIRKVQPDELRSYTQIHLFAGIGGWSRALRLAGWPDDRPVWTGSCPCPPFSSAGKKKHCPACGGKPIPHPCKTGIFACVPCGHEWHADGRHLWPEMLRLLAGQSEFPTTFGEQVAGADGLIWLSGVRAALEDLGAAAGAADLCAASIGAPHIRQRLWWVAHAEHGRQAIEEQGAKPWAQSTRMASGLGDAVGAGLEGHAGDGNEGRESGRVGAITAGPTSASGAVGRLADADEPELQREPPTGEQPVFEHRCRIIRCRDGKLRRIPTEPALFPLADRLPGRVGMLRGAGNAIHPEAAAAFIQAFVDISN